VKGHGFSQSRFKRDPYIRENRMAQGRQRTCEFAFKPAPMRQLMDHGIQRSQQWSTITLESYNVSDSVGSMCALSAMGVREHVDSISEVELYGVSGTSDSPLRLLSLRSASAEHGFALGVLNLQLEADLCRSNLSPGSPDERSQPNLNDSRRAYFHLTHAERRGLKRTVAARPPRHQAIRALSCGR